MKLTDIYKVHDGTYLHGYELSYQIEPDRMKTYEIVSRNASLRTPEDLGSQVAGVSMVVFQNDRLLLLQEFRMGINRTIYNLCAGMCEPGESMEDCMKRELKEETGLDLTEIKVLLPPSYAAVAISDMQTQIAIVEAAGTPTKQKQLHEDIIPKFYNREEVAELLRTQSFSSRAQIMAYFYVQHML
ncbi:MAG: NUDIX hydrolase [Lachnospiraceae bacterium]|nr:NUDIX hydrolase [Lachnospiraceae bacterium]